MENQSIRYAIIVAGGSGTRMGTDIAKQYLEIGGKPVLMHTLNQFFVHDPAIRLLLVLPESDFSYWDKLCKKYRFTIPHQLVKGGASRFASVSNGLSGIAGNSGLVAIHDGVRPFVNGQVIREGFDTAAKSGSAIAVVSLKDSIREIKGPTNSVFRNREQFRLVQTPQTFQLAKIKSAFAGGEKEFLRTMPRFMSIWVGKLV